MIRFFVPLFALAMLAACAPAIDAPVEPSTAPAEHDDRRQLADLRGDGPTLSPEQIDALWAAAKATDSHHRNQEAWLEPYSWEYFDRRPTAEIGEWQTFTVQTRASAGIDSLYVMFNLKSEWSEGPIAEIAGGSNPPSRSYCPAEWNDTTTRARRPGWNVHVQSCDGNWWERIVNLEDYTPDESGRVIGLFGDSQYLLYGIDDGNLVVYGHGNMHFFYYDPP